MTLSYEQFSGDKWFSFLVCVLRACRDSSVWVMYCYMILFVAGVLRD